MISGPPNDRGEFRMGDRWYGYPLTIADQVSRYLLGPQALDSTDGYGAKQVFTRVFQEAGLPRAIQTDNGSPFASRGRPGLTDPSVWWIERGIVPVCIEPRHPEQNGAHERMHRTLKDETASPPAGNRSAQQCRFNRLPARVQRGASARGTGPSASGEARAARRKVPASIPPPSHLDHFETHVGGTLLHDRLLRVRLCRRQAPARETCFTPVLPHG